ncbi:MAG: hypothetical protein LBK43_02645 [Treponema sp.]|jgi:hypothetical protein|nr:hypothetical protein [Treponema sp.]
MNKHINFEDNIFILNIRLRLVQDILVLEPDPELFLKKTMEDIDFIDDTLSLLLDGLLESVHLIERNEQFDNLVDIERQFVQVLTQFLTGSGNISALRFPVLREKIIFLQTHSITRQQTIDDARNEVNQTSIEPLVTTDELTELLKEY